MEIHYADKAYRTQSLLLLFAITTLSFVLLWQLHTWLQGITSQLTGSDPDTVRRWLRALLVALGFALAIPAAMLGLGLRRLATAARAEGRFPPQEWKTLRDVRVLRDQMALRWSRRVQHMGSAALLLAGLLAVWVLWALWYFR